MVDRQLGAVQEIWRYPVKSLAAEALQSAYLDERGLAGDRRSALFLTTPDKPRTGKTLRGKEQPRFHTVGTPSMARTLASGLELEVRDEGPYFDAGPVSLLFDRWLDELEAVCGGRVEALRFRPNLLVRASGEVPPEAELTDTVFRVGNVVLRVLAPITRCVTPSYDLETGASSSELLRALIQTRGNLMGVYCSVEGAGAVTLGDGLYAVGGEEG